MEQINIIDRIRELEHEISLLPSGSITVKKVKGNEYYYHRIIQNKKRIENYINFDQVAELRMQIEKRKKLEAELKKLKRSVPALKNEPPKIDAHKFLTFVRTDSQLESFAIPVKNFKKRECYSTLHNYVFGEHQDKVFILYGLRRTGKTTLIRQILLDMTDEQLKTTAFIQINSSDTLSDIYEDLNYLEAQGYKYVFIDEVTLMEDFIEGAALFSDIYACSGMKIILSGTDSLGFIFTKYEQLYDRCILLHTTFIPYREFESVLGIKGIDEYIRYGGTMSMGGINYNELSSFATNEQAGEYIDSAIARNIQHSLKHYQDGGHFRHLYNLYEKDELTNAINRVIQDMNHRFTKEILTKAFVSNDLSISSRNLLHDRNNPINVIKNIDKEFVTELLKAMLDIIDKEEQTIEIDDVHVYQIKEYLTLLDLIMEVDLLHLPNVNLREKITIISQPGIRYTQSDALVNSLLLDEKFNSLSADLRNRILDRILSEIKGRMMEDIVLLETKLAYPKKQVFQLQFDIGEFDMVVYDPSTLSCEIYEIKYSKEIVPNQYKYLTDENNCANTEHRFGTITGRFVIYRGENNISDGVQYLNVEDYLTSLS